MRRKFLTSGMKRSNVNRNANTSAVGYDSHIPSSCQNLGNISINGRKKSICRDMAVRKAGVAFPIDWNSTEPTTWKPIKKMQRDINLAARVDCMMREESLVKMRMIGPALITSGKKATRDIIVDIIMESLIALSALAPFLAP